MTGTIEDCKAACLTKPWCKSFDYYKSGNECILSDKNQYDVGGLNTHVSYDYYEKISK